MIVEICANSFESAIAAQNGGANRIELCTQLAVGGLTPTHQLIKKVMPELSIPVHVLVRPRKGNFCYSKEELNIMKNDIEFCKSIKGFASSSRSRKKARRQKSNYRILG